VSGPPPAIEEAREQAPLSPAVRRDLALGPLAWAATIGLTTLLLFALQHVLWLVVPLLLAIILYYALYPPMQRLMHAGMRRESAAALVAGAFLLLAAIALIPMLPWLAAQSVAGEEALERYLEGGRLLIERTLAALEAQFGFLRRLDFRAEMSARLSTFGETFVQQRLAESLLAIALWLPSLLLAPFLAFFFLRDGRRFLKLLGSSVPNAYFERTLYMLDRVDHTARNYFQGLLKLTAIDAVLLAAGLAVIGVSYPIALGVLSAVLAWVPFVGSVIACVIVVLVAATDLPTDPWVVYQSVGLFVAVRLLDDFVFLPVTVGRSLHMHPLPTVLLIFIGGAVAGVPGLILALPLAGVVMVVAGTIGGIVIDPRLRARHAFARRLRQERVEADLRE
jgi:predicted PurR-regulated permease PerM